MNNGMNKLNILFINFLFLFGVFCLNIYQFSINKNMLYIENPFEAFSSISYAYLWYTVRDVNTYISMYLLSVSSFSLWYRSTKLNGIIDVTCIILVIL